MSDYFAFSKNIFGFRTSVCCPRRLLSLTGLPSSLDKQDTIQPPTLIALALPHLPPPIPAIVTNGMKYLQMGGVFLDDIATLVVGMGVLVAVGQFVDK